MGEAGTGTAGREQPGGGSAVGGPRLLAVRDAAVYLGLTPWQVRGLVWAGTLPSVRIGRRLYLDRRDLDALPDRLKHRAATPVPLRRVRP